MLMSISGLSVAYGPIKALDGVSLEVAKGEIVSIIGANGAGKSTMLRTVAGILKPLTGTILFREREITRQRPDRIVRQGICMVPEGRRIFPNLSVKENLELGGHTLRSRELKATLFDMVLRTFPRIRERLTQHAGTLSGGEQQMLALGRALMGNPDLLLLDEPSMGLSPLITQETFALIRRINEEKGISIVLVEQNAHMALDYSHRAYVLETGRIVLEGPSRSVKCNPAVVDAYLGFEEE
ncbi:MAG: ABC transporter ATP-binding protein [Syntrophorhabdales bacterium]|jgi:branched-chain amino acid transport system ATP-binding protein